MVKIFITGATGFLGGHIVNTLLQEPDKYDVTALKREKSNDWRCSEVKDRVKWVKLDEQGNWQDHILNFNPSIFIHCAWIGVEASERDDLKTQIKNIDLLASLLELAKKLKLKKFINLGSQAEYGILNKKVDETYIPNPVVAYGYVKLASLSIFKAYSEANSINWIWLRVFSILGEMENHNWLIPSLINTMKASNEMNFTEGEQKFSYLYVKDFSEIILKIIISPVESGIYNVSSTHLYTLREIVEKVKDKVKPEFKLNFGALPYRIGQSMHIEGDIRKLEKQIGDITFTDFAIVLEKTIKYYLADN